MRALILAAGQGTRLRPLTDDRPKCMVALAGRPLLHWQIAAARSAGINDIWVVSGYREDQLQAPHGTSVTRCHNPRFAETNMVYSLWSARDALNGDVLISYADIVCETRIIRATTDASSPIAVAIDKGWLSYWQRRFADPLADAESLRLDDSGNLLDIGRKVSNLAEIQGQYIGLIRLNAAGCRLFLERMTQISQADPRRFERMYMTDLLTDIISGGARVAAVPIDRGWVEIDSLDDHRLAESLAERSGDLVRFRDSPTVT